MGLVVCCFLAGKLGTPVFLSMIECFGVATYYPLGNVSADDFCMKEVYRQFGG